MRNVGVVVAAASLAVLLAGCGKSATSNQARPPPSDTGHSSAATSGVARGEPSDAQKRAAVATLPAPFSQGDLANGEAKFAACRSCHTLTPGGPDLTGPNLSGIFGRRVASKPGYAYSDVLKAQSFNWDAPHLDTWLTDPKAMVADTKMTFVGLKDPNDRRDMIAYLKAETTTVP